MRSAFFRALVRVAERRPDVHLIVGDIGFGAIEAYVSKFPDRFLNVGVAEQNLTGIAAGMALSGKTVFTYSIGNFPTLRCLEQIRNDVCYHRANVKIVAIGGGFAYGALGMTHHATEDLAILRALPEMTVIAPADPVEAEYATQAVAAHKGPCYLRLGRAGEAVVHRSSIDFEIGKAIQVREGTDVTFISTGGLLATALEVADALAEMGSEARVLSMHTVKPLDVDAILAAARDTRAIVTLEEHSIIGGLGSAVAEVLAETADTHVSFKRLGVGMGFSRIVGSQNWLRHYNGLSVEAILQSVMPLLATSEAR